MKRSKRSNDTTKGTDYHGKNIQEKRVQENNLITIEQLELKLRNLKRNWRSHNKMATITVMYN